MCVKKSDQTHLFPVSLDQGEHEASVHDRQQIIEEEGKTGVQPLHQLEVLIERGEKLFISLTF